MARGIHKLTAGDLRRKQPGLYNDGGGLYLRITAAPDDGAWRSWIGRYAFNGRTRDMGLGSTALIGLAEVRRMWHGELRPLLRQGIDPIEHRKAGRLAQAAATARAMSVDQCIDAYYQAYRGTWRSAKHARGWLQTLRTNFSPVIGAMPVAAVERQDVVRALQPYWQTAQTSAHRTALRLENVFDWAIAAGYRAGPNPAQWAGGLEHLLPRTKTVADTRHVALPYRELPAFMDRLRAIDRARRAGAGVPDPDRCAYQRGAPRRLDRDRHRECAVDHPRRADEGRERAQGPAGGSGIAASAGAASNWRIDLPRSRWWRDGRSGPAPGAGVAWPHRDHCARLPLELPRLGG